MGQRPRHTAPAAEIPVSTLHYYPVSGKCPGTLPLLPGSQGVPVILTAPLKIKSIYLLQIKNTLSHDRSALHVPPGR